MGLLSTFWSMTLGSESGKCDDCKHFDRDGYTTSFSYQKGVCRNKEAHETFNQNVEPENECHFFKRGKFNKYEYEREQESASNYDSNDE